MPRIIPLRGTEAQRQTVQTAGKILTGELHATTDQKRLFYEAQIVAPYYHGTVADEAAMLALNSGTRGCWQGDWCKRTDTGFIYTCITSNGTSTGHWISSLPGGTSLSGAFNGTVGATTPSTGAFLGISSGTTGSDGVFTLNRSSDGAGAATLRYIHSGQETRLFSAVGPVTVYASNALAATFTSTGINSTPIGSTTPSTVAATTISATVANSTLAARFSGATGKVRVMGYDGGRAYIDAVNTAESSNIPLTIVSSNLKFAVGTFEGEMNAQGLSLVGTTPQCMLYDNTSTANNRRWDFIVFTDKMEARLINDANSSAAPWLTVTRSGNTPTAVKLYNLNDTPIGNVTPSSVVATTLTLNGKAVLEGPADSGGVGFKLLRVAN